MMSFHEPMTATARNAYTGTHAGMEFKEYGKS